MLEGRSRPSAFPFHGGAMPELPWVKWYPQLWISETGLSFCEAATQGIWANLLNHMLLSGKATISGSPAQLAALCRCRPFQIQTAAAELKQHCIAEVEMQNECISFTCRRIARDCSIKELRSSAAKTRWSKPYAKGMQSSPSTSSSKGVQGGNGMSEADKVTADKALGRALLELRDIRRGDIGERERARIKVLKAEIVNLQQKLGVYT
jgi:hypothetical protein